MVLPQGVRPMGGAGFWGMGVVEGEGVDALLGGSGVVFVSAKTILAVKKDTVQIKSKTSRDTRPFIYGPIPN